MNRRQWLSVLAASLPLSRTAFAHGQQTPAKPAPLDLQEFQPRSMLKVPATSVPKARFPVIDFHTHLGFSAKSVSGVSHGEERKFRATPAELLPVMDRVNLQTMVNLTGGFGSGLRESIALYQTAHPGRFLTFTEPRWSTITNPNYAR